MHRCSWVPGLVASVVLSLVAAGPVAAQSAEATTQRLDDLSRRVEALERAAAGSKAAPAPGLAAKGIEPTQKEAIALYADVDRLIAQGKMDEARKSMAAFEQAHPNTQASAWMRSLAGEMAVIGKPAPATWSIDKWFQGEGDVVLDGQRPTVLVFWEEWCGVCKNEAPRIQKLWDAHRAEGLQVIGVTRVYQTSTDESVSKFLADAKLTYPVAKETGALTTYFEVKPIPAAAVVKGGKIVWRGHAMRLTDEILKLWL